MSDKTVPADADDYKRDIPADDSDQDRNIEHDSLVEEAKSHEGEPPNRDEDEFTGKGLKAPDVETQVEKEIEDSDNA